MITKEKSSYYLRYLIKKTDTRPISYNQIPQPFQNYFSLPALSQSLNISMKYPDINFDKVENFFDEYMFHSYNDLTEAIVDTFQTTFDKLYAVYYYTTNNIKYDYQRSLQKYKKLIAIEKLFKIQKGVCCDYCNFFIQLSKQVGITSDKMKIVFLNNHSKNNKFNKYNPPKKPCITHACVFIEYNGQQYVCDPTWGAGYLNDENVFIFDYSKSYFLIPFFQALLIYYPKDMPISSKTCIFSFNQFTSLNKPNLKKELSFESNPFQVIHVKNGFHEMQFSFIQPCDELSSQFHFLEQKTWTKYNNMFVCFDCLSNNVPNHKYSIYPNRNRCRYKMSVSFPMKGTWRVKVFVDTNYLFEVYYEVENANISIKQIPGYDKNKKGFYPIFPREGLATVDNGIATIRYAIKQKYAPFIAYFYQIKNGTFQRKSENENNEDVFYNYVTLNLPFDISYKNSREKLVENWINVEFNKKGRWEVFIYFKDDDIESNNYIYGVKYYFDVIGITKPKRNSIPYDIPIKRTFAPIYKFCKYKFKVEPSSSTIILNNECDFYFHVKCDKKYKLNAFFVYYENFIEKSIFPVLIHEKISDNDTNIIDRKYSITFEKCGYYTLKFFTDKFIGCQNYFIVDSNLPKESSYEKKLMNLLQNEINGTTNYTKDIDKSIRDKVIKMYNSLNKNQIKDEHRFDEINNDQISTKKETKIDQNEKKKTGIKINQNEVVEKVHENIEKNQVEIYQNQNDLLIQEVEKLKQENEKLKSCIKDKQKQIDEIISQFEQKELVLTNKIIDMEKMIENNNDYHLHSNNYKIFEDKSTFVNFKKIEALSEKNEYQSNNANDQIANEFESN